MTAVGGTDARDKPFANWTIGQLLLLVLTLLISIFVINCPLLAFTGLLAWWSLVRHANCNLCQPEGFKSSTSTDCKFIDFSWWEWCLWTALLLGLKGPLSSVSHCWSSFTTWTYRHSACHFRYLWSTVSPSFDRSFACRLTGESEHLCKLCISAIFALISKPKARIRHTKT